jgi:hypothetical protein
LESVSENLLRQMTGVANQGQSIARAASALEGTIAETGDRARNATEQLVHNAAAHSQAAAAELERLRAQTDLQTTHALEEVRAKVSGVSQEVSQHLGAMANRFSETSE